MATYTKFFPFTKALGDKKHNLTSDSLIIALTNTAPSQANAVLADIAEISYTNLSSRAITTTSFNTSSGTATLILADLTLTASGAVATFQYVVLYNNTATNKDLIAYWNYGTPVTMQNTETFKTDFDNVLGVLTIA